MLYLLALGKKQNEEVYALNEDDLPEVTIVLAAYNEESGIQEKIDSTFATQYPADKITLFIGSDASTDKTETIIQEAMQRYPTIKLKRFPGRTGKAGIVNDLVQEAKSDILVLTDANVFFTPDTIFELV
jgi:cellulose synthase/poly-beta-1,6-N-acetylglucosamine synthase-like glycosyltransferase